MPIPFLAAMGVAESAMNPVLQHLQNVKNRKFAREMYDRQRQDALIDWQTQNAYNSPKAQMERFKEAGLNPHLIYGQTNEAPAVRSSSSSSSQGTAPSFEPMSKIGQAYDVQMRSAQIDQTKEATENLKKQREVMNADILAKLKSVGFTDARIAEIMQNMEQRKTLFPHQLESARLANEKTESDIALAWRKDMRETLMNESNLEKQAEEIASLIKGRQKTQADIDRIRQEIILMRKDGTLKDYDIAYRKAGGNPNDATALKIWDGILRRLGIEDPQGFAKENKLGFISPALGIIDYLRRKKK